MVDIILTGTLLDDDMRLSLAELSRTCAVHAEWILELVDEGILEPDGDRLECWTFSASSIFRTRRVLRLQRDLGINLSGVAVVLNLQEEIERLRRRLDVIQQNASNHISK